MDDSVFRVKKPNTFVDTATAKEILIVLRRTAEHPQMGIGLIVGAPGVGKSTTIKHFQSKHAGVYICTADKTMGSMSSLLVAVGKCMNLYPTHRISDMNASIVEKMRPGIEEYPLLIIDEAHELNDKQIDQLRHIYDAAGCGLVLCGNATFKNRFNRTQQAAFAQVISRLGLSVDIAESSEEDIQDFCSARSIRGKPEIDFLLRYGRTLNGLRTIDKFVGQAKQMPGGATLDNLKKVSALLELGR